MTDASRPALRLVVVDDHEVVRQGLVALLDRRDAFQVVGEAGTVAEAMAVVHRMQPDLVIMDVRLPDGSGIEACRDIRAEMPEIRPFATFVGSKVSYKIDRTGKVTDAKGFDEIMERALAPEVDALVRRLQRLPEAAAQDLGPHAIRAALRSVIAAFDVYRTYADADGMTGADRDRVRGAVARARATTLGLDPAALDLIEAVLLLAIDRPEAHRLPARRIPRSFIQRAKRLQDLVDGYRGLQPLGRPQRRARRDRENVGGP